MQKKIKIVFRYIRFFFQSTNEHGIHSPFIFHFTTNIIYATEPFYAYNRIEKQRIQLLKTDETITITDLGAGSKKLNATKRKIKDIAQHSLKPAKYSQLIFRIANHFQPKTILELGTSLGITTSYLALHNSQCNVITIEGCESIANKAKETFNQLKIKNIQQVVGNFDHVLQPSLKNIQSLDFVFIDGNHRKAPTINYFNEVLEKCTANSIIILDDIHWSDEMEEAWNEIKSHQKVRVTVDLFYLGIVFFRMEQQKEHFKIRF